jgi:hypothetical protein
MIFVNGYPLENVGFRGRLQAETPQIVEIVTQLAE